MTQMGANTEQISKKLVIQTGKQTNQTSSIADSKANPTSHNGSLVSPINP